MKSSKTMYEIAKAKALERGPKVFESYCGFITNRSELLELFRAEGFKDETVDRFVKRWIAAKQMFYYQNIIVFEPLPDDYRKLNEYATAIQETKGHSIFVVTREVFA